MKSIAGEQAGEHTFCVSVDGQFDGVDVDLVSHEVIFELDETHELTAVVAVVDERAAADGRGVGRGQVAGVLDAAQMCSGRIGICEKVTVTSGANGSLRLKRTVFSPVTSTDSIWARKALK